MSAWQVRKEGSTDVYRLPAAADVVTALRDGNFVPADEVKGPTDADWQPIETHPMLAEAALDVDPPPAVVADDTHLDMNPLIDVCLVLLIFFILTITYASLERALSVPEDTAEDKGVPKIHKDELKDRVFKVIVKMDGTADPCTFGAGWLSWARGGVSRDDDSTYMIHFFLGLTTVFVCLGVHCLRQIPCSHKVRLRQLCDPLRRTLRNVVPV